MRDDGWRGKRRFGLRQRRMTIGRGMSVEGDVRQSEHTKVYDRGGSNLQIRLDRFPAANNIWHDLCALVDCQ